MESINHSNCEELGTQWEMTTTKSEVVKSMNTEAISQVINKKLLYMEVMLKVSTPEIFTIICHWTGKLCSQIQKVW